MGNNAADISVVDAVPASDSAAKRLTGDERRREILAAVRAVSAELGVSHLSVSAVTKRAGCARSLFYHYFADMDAAVTAVMDEAIDGFIAELEQWNASRTVGDIEGALDTVAPLFKRLVVSGHELPSTLTSSSGALYGGFCTTWSSAWRSISAIPPWWILSPIMSYTSTMSTRRSTPSSWGC